jgi:hypothetical protein
LAFTVLGSSGDLSQISSSSDFRLPDNAIPPVVLLTARHGLLRYRLLIGPRWWETNHASISERSQYRERRVTSRWGLGALALIHRTAVSRLTL